MKSLLAGIALAAALTGADAAAQTAKPTIVLVHGAFADSTSWNGVIEILKKDGYPVVSVANPLRSVGGDGAYVSDLVASIPTPVVLVGHSYGAASSPKARAATTTSRRWCTSPHSHPMQGKRRPRCPASFQAARSARRSLLR